MIIWDLDETFWNGTLAEGTMKPIARNCEFVKDLVNHGIMVSICSKNDLADVSVAFNKIDEQLFDLFVFKSINWDGKGGRVKNIIENAGLRATNVLFIDDNEINLNEAKYYNPDLQVATPDIIPELISQVKDIEKDDHTHTRLKQYKILEQKISDKESIGSNDDFLRESNICVKIGHDCMKYIDRLHELIIRTNQLNYTKDRCSRQELIDIIKNRRIKTGYVQVSDKYGDYGIVGFYALDKHRNKLIHFVFSCRTLGMGVEQYVYSKLKFPRLEVVGDVANLVYQHKFVLYIKSGAFHQSKNKTKKNMRILMKGPCDLCGTLPYLDNNIGIDTEFIHANLQIAETVSQESSVCVVDAKRFSDQQIDEILENCPMLSRQDYTTRFYSPDYDAVIFSFLIDDLIGLYQDKKTGYIFPMGHYTIPITDKQFDKIWLDEGHTVQYKFTQQDLNSFKKKYEFLGPVSCDRIIENLNYMRENMGQDTLLVLVLGSEVPPEFELQEFHDLHIRHREMNQAITQWAANRNNVKIINLTDLVSSAKDYRDTINHFQRHVYYKLAQAISAALGNKISVHNVIRLRDVFGIDNRFKFIYRNGKKVRVQQHTFNILGLKIPFGKKSYQELN